MKSVEPISERYQRAAQAIREADGLLIAAGAGMGVDSGLPDFRGKGGFWKAYPALGKTRIDFREISSPDAFMRMPSRAWGFYGHWLNLFRDTVPHEGFRILREMAASLPNGAFVFTSNVDGQFQKAGFHENDICEIHGSVHYMQCMSNCNLAWPAGDWRPEVDLEQCFLISPLPRCPRCNELARPQILLFHDWRFIEDRVEWQQYMLNKWTSRVKNPVVIEIGAGTALPTVRRFAEFSSKEFLIRINPTDSKITKAYSKQGVSLPVGALEGLRGIAAAMFGSVKETLRKDSEESS
jgi:NAD-dependent SIR2 family protein deacetylase